MSRFVTCFFLFIALVVFLLFLPGNEIQIAFGLQTIPTRTPTPGTSPPTVPPPATAPPGDGNNDTPVPRATELVTPVASPTASPESLPLNELCSDNPTARTNDLTNIRFGPGIDYEIIEQLPYLAVRPIVGRAADAAWWLIQVDNSRQGWVADGAVIVRGYIGGVPVTVAPLIGGSTPTPGIPWNPTPFPECLEFVTATSTPSVTPLPTESPTPGNTSPGSLAGAETATATATSVSTKTGPAALADNVTTATPMLEPSTISELPSPTAIVQLELAGVLPTMTPGNQSAATAVPMIEEVPAKSSDYFLVLAALLFVIGVVIAFLRRRRRLARSPS